MFCPRAIVPLFGVGFCALLTGCAGTSSSVELNKADQPIATTRVIAADTVSTRSAVPTSRPVSREEIIEWSIRGFSDDMIIDHIDHSCTLFHVSAGEEIHLHDAGVSDEVIRAMKATAG